MPTQADVDTTLLGEITKLQAEVLALKTYVGTIPNNTPLQAIRNAFPKVGEKGFSAETLAAAHKCLDELDWMQQQLRSVK